MENPHVIVTVHGIRTFGQWQERLARLVHDNEPTATVLNYNYGYFSVVAFLLPFVRWWVTRRFRRELDALSQRYPGARIDWVGHSFGTHLIAWGLRGFPDAFRPLIHTIILAGSVLKTDSMGGFDWVWRG